jgi:hypothetical protein
VLHYTPPLMDRPDTAQAVASGAGGLAAGSEDLTMIAAAVVLPGPGRAALYGMFEALSVTPDGATLRGGLLLEVNEEVILELRLPDLSAFRARARVVEIVPDVGDERPAMKVEWTAVAEADRHRLRR